MYRYTRWSAFRELGYWIAAVPMLLPIYLVVVTSLKLDSSNLRKARARDRQATWLKA